jgi:hypothetical protein
MTTTARFDRLRAWHDGWTVPLMSRAERQLRIAQDEWPALRWRIYCDPAFTLLRGRDRRGRRVVSVCKWHDHDAWSAAFASDLGVTHVAGRTLRAAIRAARYAMEA